MEATRNRALHQVDNKKAAKRQPLQTISGDGLPLAKLLFA